MKEFFVEEFSSQESYRRFIKYMLSHSQLFSVIYFRYRENEPMKKRPKMLYEKLKKFKEYSITTSEWPGTITMDDNHIYKLVYYRAEMECFDWLIQVPGLYEWDYPYAPMDLCFYRNGYCWFSLTAHERTACLYTDKEEEIEELTALGAELTFSEDNAEIVYCEFPK